MQLLAFNDPEPSERTARSTVQDPLHGIDDHEQFMHEIAPFLKKYYPNSAETELRLSNFPDSFIEKFFKLYPELKTQSSSVPSFNFILPSAYAQSSSFSYVYGDAYYYDIDNTKVVLENTKVCAYTKTSQTYNPVLNGQTHVCDNTDTSGSFRLVGAAVFPDSN